MSVTRISMPKVEGVKMTGADRQVSTRADPFPPASIDPSKARRLTGADVIAGAFPKAPIGDPRLNVSEAIKRRRELALGVLFAAMKIDSKSV